MLSRVCACRAGYTLGFASLSRFYFFAISHITGFRWLIYWITGCVYQFWLGIALVFVVVVSGIFQYYQDSKSSKIMKAFEKLVPRVSVVCWLYSGVSRFLTAPSAQNRLFGARKGLHRRIPVIIVIYLAMFVSISRFLALCAILGTIKITELFN